MIDAAIASTTWHLYPSTKKLTAGELVYYRPKSAKAGRRGRVVQVSPEQQRATVRLEHSKQDTSIALKRLMLVYNTSGSMNIILTRDTHPYRHLAASQTQSDDHVLEIGCSTGGASSIIMRSTPNWIGFDVSSDMVQQTYACLQKMGCMVMGRVHKHDVLVDPMGAQQLIRQCYSEGPSVVFVDIGGNRDMNSAIRILGLMISTFTPRLVVIKNRELVDECLSDCRVNTHGVLQRANDWFHTKHFAVSTSISSFPDHPLQARMVFSPLDGTTPLCRYHNYHEHGCKKADECPFDHNHCHQCRLTGHVAKDCPMRLN